MRRHGDGRDGGKSFGALLKRYRLDAGLSQESLAERARLSTRAISSYERGIRQAPYRDTLEQLARALNLSEQERIPLEAAVRRRRRPRSAEQSAHTSAANQTNLPAQMTTFVGRRREIAEVKRLLEQTRMVTLVGTDGCGKTRLALQAAGELVGAYPNGIRLVGLSSLSNPSLVPHAVATAIGVRDEPGQPLLKTLCAALRNRRLLLVLDNCQHLGDACAQLGEELLRECANLRILATSRQTLGIAAEIGRRVPSLIVPEPSHDLTPITVSSYEAVRLFIERAQAAGAGFALSAQNVRAVAQLCQRLDGIPLAIELAAAQVQLLSVEQIVRRLDDHIQLLPTGSDKALPRRGTVRATLDWSYSLLTDSSQTLLRRLGVFVGNFNLDAAESVGGGKAGDAKGWGWSQLHSVQDATLSALSVEDMLAALVGKSMLQVEEVDGEVRYRLLEPIRQFAREKLLDSGEDETARRRHRKWHRSLVEHAKPELAAPRRRLWLDRIEHEHADIRAVIEGTVVERGELAEGFSVAAPLVRLWIVRGYLGEGRYLLGRLLGASEADPHVLRTAAGRAALHSASLAAYLQRDLTAARRLADEWLRIARELGDESEVCLANNMVAQVFVSQGDDLRARAIFVDQLATSRRLGYSFGIASAAGGLGVMARVHGDYEQAILLGEECLTESRQTGDLWFIGHALSNLGLAHYQDGQYGIARKLFTEALTLRHELDDRPGIACSLINLGQVGQAQGDLSGARVGFEESLAILGEVGDRSGQADALAWLGRVAQARGDFASARVHFHASLTLQRELGERVAMAQVIEDLAGLAAAQRNELRALTLTYAAATIREPRGAARSALDQGGVEQWSGLVRQPLGGKAAQAQATANAMTLDQTIAYALADGEATTEYGTKGVGDSNRGA